jgi:sigma-B regulation protein RsbU (phosphoserine phosphatase)
MAKLQSTIRALAPDFRSLVDLGNKLNQIFCRDSIPNIFASLVYLELHSDSGRIRLVNAGHFPPVIIRGNRAEKLEKGGAALGILPSAVFHEQAVDLDKDDLLLVYSDGLTEARNEAGEYFGEQRLLELLERLANRTTREIGEGLIGVINQFVGEARLNDDLSVALLKRV